MDRAGENWIARNEALARLRVKTQTLYAYVSRGRIAARPDPVNPRRSLYAAADIQRLSDGGPAASETPRLPSDSAPGRGEASIESAVSLILDGRLFYRGRDVVQLAEAATLEDAARVLWDARADNPFATLKPRVDVAFAGSPQARALSFMARRAFEDASSAGRSLPDLQAEAGAILGELVDAVAGAGPRLHLHQRLARAWRMPERDGQLLRRALVLCADQGLDAAVTATRVAVGAGSSLASGVMAGFGGLGSTEACGGLKDACALAAAARGRAERVLDETMTTLGELPGFGGSPLGDVDARAEALIAASELPSDLAEIVSRGRALTSQAPTLDLALALAARRMELPRDAACDIWMIARAAGLLAHGLDQATNGSPIRARLRYVGVVPGAH